VTAAGAAVRIAWPAVDHPAVAGYWVAIRGAGESTLDDLRWVAKATQLELPGPPAGWVAVAAADAAGHMSLFSPEAALSGAS
jgi:hypothetical protein